MTVRQKLLTAKTRALTAVGAASAPAGALWGYDSTNVAAMPAGGSVYAGYGAGTYDNWAALVRRFPALAAAGRLVSIEPGVLSGIMCIDIEPGNESDVAQGVANAIAFIRLPGHGRARRPILYVMASWADGLVAGLRAAGIPDTAYFLWTAHYIGQHLCSASSCGYSRLRPADATQYASNNAYDTSIWQGYVFAPQSATPNLAEGASDGAGAKSGPVHTLQERLNAWHAAYGYLMVSVDGNFGPGTLVAVRAFQAAAKLAVTGTVTAPVWTALDKTPPAPPKPPVLPAAPLSATPHTVTTRTIAVERAIPGFTGTYTTTLKDATGKLVDSAAGTTPHLTFTVTAPGRYTVLTTATGYAPTLRAVTVE